MHEGHRMRMYEKLSNPNGLHDHELLEVLLFGVIPRVNTNPIAHNLLDKFGTMSGVFNASYEQLVTVEGVGEKTARHIVCVGECMKRAANGYAGVTVLKTIGDFKKFIVARLRGLDREVLEFYFIDKGGKVFSIKTFSNYEQNTVSLGTEEISRILASEKPHGLLVAHNHLSGSCAPSDNDDRFTIRISALCSIHNTRLYDHYIYASDKDVYSYYNAGELEGIKKNFNFNTLLENHIANDLQKK